MSSSPDDRGSIAASASERGAARAARRPGWQLRDDRSQRLLRGGLGRAAGHALPRAGPVQHPSRRESPAPQPQVEERRTTIRRPRTAGSAAAAPTFRLGDVYAEELERLRQHAHDAGFRGRSRRGHEGSGRGRRARPSGPPRPGWPTCQARWERRVASAVAALGAAASRFDEATVPVADDVRDTIIGTVLTLLEDLLGRELALADSPVLDAVRRALALVPGRLAGRRPGAPRRPRRDPGRDAGRTPRDRRASSPTRTSSGPARSPRPVPGASTPSSWPRWSGCRQSSPHDDLPRADDPGPRRGPAAGDRLGQRRHGPHHDRRRPVRRGRRPRRGQPR